MLSHCVGSKPIPPFEIGKERLWYGGVEGGCHVEAPLPSKHSFGVFWGGWVEVG